MAKLIDFSHQGQLEKRGDVTAFQGAYGEIIKGVNEMLDAILLPIGEGNRILRQISGGNLRDKVEIECKGDHQRMKEAINGVHSWLKELIAYVTAIANGDMTRQDGQGLQRGPDPRMADDAESEHRQCRRRCRYAG